MFELDQAQLSKQIHLLVRALWWVTTAPLQLMFQSTMMYVWVQMFECTAVQLLALMVLVASKGKDGWQKISQIGGVLIGDKVEIGACTTIDRGAINDTIIGDNVILDNHVQIAHNAIIGDNTAMAAYAGVAGSTIVGKNCVLAAGAHVVGHASLCDNVQIMAHSLVFKDIKQPNSYQMPPCH